MGSTLATLKYLPPATFAVAPQAVLNRVAAPAPATVQQATLAAENAPLPIIFGTDRRGPAVAYAMVHQNRMVILAVWGFGEIDGIAKIEMDDAPAPVSVLVKHYTGTATQTVDPTLVAAFAAQKPAKLWTSALPGIAYSVFQVPPTLSTGFPRFTALIRGLKIFDDRTGNTAYSDNPTLCLAHFLRHTDGYGMGKTVQSASVIAAANANDELVAGERRRLLGWTIDTVQRDLDIVEALRTYAGCFVHGLALDEVKLIPDRPREAVRTLDFALGHIKAIGPIEQADVTQAPTYIQIGYRDTTSTPWRDTYGPGAYAPGVESGTVDFVPSQVALPGIRRRSQAAREEIERLNKLTLANLSFWVDVFDEQIDLEIGDRIDIIHPLIGPAAKPMMLVRHEGEYGRYRLHLTEYDPAVHSDVVVAEPTWSDISLPTPSTPPTPGAVTLAEENFQMQDGTWAARIYATWIGVSYPFLLHYQVTIRQGVTVVGVLTPRDTAVRTGPLQEGKTYQVDVQTVSTGTVASEVSSSAIAITGADQPPADVTTWLTAVEAGGAVYFAWLPVATPGATRYRMKWGGVGGSYATATRLDDFDATSYVARGLPAGLHRFYLVALTRYGVESLVPLTRDINITLDPSLLITARTFTAPTLTAMSYTRANRTQPGVWVTDFGDALAYGHADPNDASGTFADLAAVPFVDPHTSGTSAWESESWDVGINIAGSWAVEAAVTLLAGAARSIKLRLSQDNAAWTDTEWQGTPIIAEGRYVRIRIESAGTIEIADPVGATVTVATRRDPNSGLVTTSASGPTTVTLAGRYAKIAAVPVTPRGTSAKTVTWDNAILGADVVNTIDIYAFNAAGVQIATEVSWAFEGI